MAGFHTSGDMATAMGTTHKTVVNMIDAGLIKAAVTPGGHRKILDESMQVVQEAAQWADGISTTVPRSDLICGYMRWAALPMGGRPRVLDFVHGWCVARFGLETRMSEFPR